MKSQILASPLVICGLFAAAATFASTAQAGTREGFEVFQFEFSYDRDQLTSEAGANKLLSRLQREVRSHCGGDQKIPPSQRAVVNECIDRTLGASIGKFGSSTLTQVYQSRAAG